MEGLRNFLETAAQPPKEQVSAGQIPIASKLLLVPSGQTPGELHSKLLEMTSAVMVGAAFDLVEKKTYNQLGTAEDVVQGLNDVTDTVYDKFTAGFASFLNIGVAPRIAVDRQVPRADLHRELVKVLFEDVVGTSELVLGELDAQLTEFVQALSSLPTDVGDKEMRFFFFSSQVSRKNIGGENNPFYLVSPIVRMHLVRMSSTIYRELVTKKPSKKASKKAKDSSSARKEAPSWRDLLIGIQDQEQEEDNEDNITLQADYFIIKGELETSVFDQQRGNLDNWMRNVTGKTLKEYADQTTKALYV